jgi:hypothetical protein
VHLVVVEVGVLLEELVKVEQMCLLQAVQAVVVVLQVVQVQVVLVKLALLVVKPLLLMGILLLGLAEIQLEFMEQCHDNY